MNRKLYIMSVMAVLLLFMSAAFSGITAKAEETGTELIASGACGEMHYEYESEESDNIVFYVDESVQYRLYKDGTMVISGNGEMGDFDRWKLGSHTWYRRKELNPWYDYRDNIRKVIVEDGVTTIGSASFYGCKNLESVQWADSINQIGDRAFYGCKSLKSIPWTDCIEELGDSVFQKCSGLKEVRLPHHVKECGNDVFAECTGLKKVSVDEEFRFRVNYQEKDDWDYVEGTEDLFPIIENCYGDGMFRGCTALEEIKLPKDSPVIPSRFVEGCTALKIFPIPDNVNYWGSCPPSLCKGEYVLPDSVRKLGDGAFAGCSDLEELVLPNGLVYMGKAFEGCSSLKTVKIPESVGVLNETFYHCTGLESIVIPDTVQNLLYYLDFGNCRIFEGCSNLKSVVLPKNMEYIGSNLFRNCTSLKKIKLPPNLKEIGDSAFSDCRCLTDIKLPDTVYYIGSYAFSGCTSLKEMDIPKGIHVFYDKVFYNCKKLKSVTVRAKSFKFYGEKIFYGCKKLSQITLYATKIEDRIDKKLFDGIPKGVTIYVPKGCVDKFKKQFQKAKVDMSKIDIKPMQ